MPAILPWRVAYALSALVFLSACSSPVSSHGDGSARQRARTSNSITIANDNGGQILGYVVKSRELRRSRKTIRFVGRCDSACTLYLGNPNKCIAPGATFGFHAPYGTSAKANRRWKAHMNGAYPNWVRSWLGARGGLTDKLKVMPYHYARRYIRACPTTA